MLRFMSPGHAYLWCPQDRKPFVCSLRRLRAKDLLQISLVYGDDRCYSRVVHDVTLCEEITVCLDGLLQDDFGMKLYERQRSLLPWHLLSEDVERGMDR